MDFLKKLFGLGGQRRDGALYVYVKPKACDEILKVRIDLAHQLSLRDEGEGYFTRKIARGKRCPFPVEMRLYFNQNKQLVEREIDQGEFVDEAAYREYAGEDADA